MSDDFKRRLAGSDGQSQRQRSARLRLHRNVMVSLIDTLEEQGLVKRKPPPDDARSRSRSLTGPATCCPVLEGQSHAMEDEVTAALTPAERAALLAMLQRVSASLGLSPGVHPRLAGRPD